MDYHEGLGAHDELRRVTHYEQRFGRRYALLLRQPNSALLLPALRLRALAQTLVHLTYRAGKARLAHLCREDPPQATPSRLILNGFSASLSLVPRRRR